MALAAYMYIMSLRVTGTHYHWQYTRSTCCGLDTGTQWRWQHTLYNVHNVDCSYMHPLSFAVYNGVGSIHVNNVVYSCRHTLSLAVYTFNMSLVRYRYPMALSVYRHVEHVHIATCSYRHILSLAVCIFCRRQYTRSTSRWLDTGTQWRWQHTCK